MTRRQTDPLRPLTDDEHDWLTRVARSQAEPAAHVARAKALLAVADGESYTDAAKAAGLAVGLLVGNLVGSRRTLRAYRDVVRLLNATYGSSERGWRR
jgi:hypothetical protein